MKVNSLGYIFFVSTFQLFSLSFFMFRSQCLEPPHRALRIAVRNMAARRTQCFEWSIWLIYRRLLEVLFVVCHCCPFFMQRNISLHVLYMLFLDIQLLILWVLAQGNVEMQRKKDKSLIGEYPFQKTLFIDNDFSGSVHYLYGWRLFAGHLCKMAGGTLFITSCTSSLLSSMSLYVFSMSITQFQLIFH